MKKKLKWDHPELIRMVRKGCLIMRLFLFLMILGVLHSTASVSQTKRFNLNERNISVKDALKLIEEQSGYRFFYEENLLNVNKKLSINISNSTIDEVLDQLLGQTGIEYKLMDNNFVVLKSKSNGNRNLSGMMQQAHSVSGKVTDSSGVPLPGVTLVIKGTTQGTITGADGKYSLSNVPANATLVFSFVGMRSQEIAVNNRQQIDLSLKEETIGIEEVVAIGYGTMKKSDITGSVVKADIESFRESPNVSIMQSLQGTVPGLNVSQVDQSGENPEISIRGQNTISGSSSPLIVVDGIIFRGNLIDLNPNDIESVDVLKDASSTAIYGSEAANGVLIITTKSGKGYIGKPKITYSGSYSFQTPSHDLVPMNREGYVKKLFDAFWQENRLGPDYFEPDPNTKWSVYAQFKGTQHIEGYDDGTDENWHDLLTDNGYIQNHDVSITGGTDKINYYSSFGYTEQDGWLLNDDYKRYNIRINLDNKINNWLKIGTQSFMSISDYSGVSPSLTQIWFPPICKAYNADGTPVLEPTALGVNPLINVLQPDLEKRLNLFGNVYAEINFPFIEGLSYKVNYSRNYRHDRHYNFNENGNNYQGTAYKNHDLFNDWTFDNILTFNRNFNKIHNLTLTLVYGRENRYAESTDAYSSIFINDILGYNALESGAILEQTASSGAWEENSLYSMGRLVYNYKKKYLFTGTYRRDGFSGFGENKKFGEFPSVAVAWVLSEENFIKNNLPVFDYLKVRASYGTNGNRTVSRYQTLAKVSSEYAYIYGDGGSAELSQWVSSMANPNLGWETTTGLNVAMDFTLLNQRISGSIEYYNTKTNDLLYNINIPTMTGFSSISTNIGELHNHGLEVSLTTVNVKKKDVNWQTTFVFSRNRNKVKSILGIDDDGDGKEDDLKASNIFIGEPLGVLYNYKVVGMYQLGDEIPSGFYAGNYKIADLNNDGGYSAEKDRKILGYTNPGYRFGIQSKLTYKNWALHIFINSIQGGKDYYYGNGSPQGSWGDDVAAKFAEGNSIMWDYWMPENPNAKHERLGYVSSFQTILPVQRNFVRLQDISLSYTVPSKFVQRYQIQGLKLFVSGKNIHTWTKWEGWDPETGLGLVPGGRPVMANYTLGVTLEL